MTRTLFGLFARLSSIIAVTLALVTDRPRTAIAIFVLLFTPLLLLFSYFESSTPQVHAQASGQRDSFWQSQGYELYWSAAIGESDIGRDVREWFSSEWTNGSRLTHWNKPGDVTIARAPDGSPSVRGIVPKGESAQQFSVRSEQLGQQGHSGPVVFASDWYTPCVGGNKVNGSSGSYIGIGHHWGAVPGSYRVPAGSVNHDDSWSLRGTLLRSGGYAMYAYIPDKTQASGRTFGTAVKPRCDVWETVELEVIQNDIGSKNGILRMYVNGTKISEATNLIIRTQDTRPRGMGMMLKHNSGAPESDEQYYWKNWRIYVKGDTSSTGVGTDGGGNTGGGTSGGTTGGDASTPSQPGATTIPPTGGVECHAIQPGAAIPAEYGAPYNFFKPYRDLLIRSTGCNPQQINVRVGDGAPDTYAFTTSYYWGGETWVPVQLTGAQTQGVWAVGSANGSFATRNDVMWYVAYTCHNTDAGWRCGCATQACDQSLWQVQRFSGPALTYAIAPGGGGSTGGSTSGGTSGGSTGGGSTGGGGDVAPAAGFPEITSCGETQTVSPGTNLSSLGSQDGCRTIVALPGSYPRMSINGHSGGVVTLRCQEPGACSMGTGSVIDNSDGVVFDGFKISGGSNGLTIDESDNVLVKNSIFFEQTNSGVLLDPGGMKENIQIYNNQFISHKTGCSIVARRNGGNQCGYLDDGSPIAEMDYGLRVYATASIAVRGNLFTSIFNHSISLKNSVDYALIEDNRLEGCGRVCIQLGQELSGNESIEALVKDNRITGKSLRGILVQRIRKATLVGNYIEGSVTPIRIDNEIKPDGEREVIQSNNTIK